jgi:ankyrin repeat protein
MARPGRPRKHDPIADDIRRLISSGADGDARDLIVQHEIDLLDGGSATPLIWASFYGRTELLAWLIKRGGSVDHQDRDGYCALHFAAQERNARIAETLLKAGAATDLRDIYGNTPLWTAGFNARGDYTTFKLLLDHGASLNNTNNAGKTVRDLAMKIFSEEMKEYVPVWKSGGA